MGKAIRSFCSKIMNSSFRVHQIENDAYGKVPIGTGIIFLSNVFSKLALKFGKVKIYSPRQRFLSSQSFQKVVMRRSSA